MCRNLRLRPLAESGILSCAPALGALIGVSGGASDGRLSSTFLRALQREHVDRAQTHPLAVHALPQAMRRATAAAPVIAKAHGSAKRIGLTRLLSARLLRPV